MIYDNFGFTYDQLVNIDFLSLLATISNERCIWIIFTVE